MVVRMSDSPFGLLFDRPAAVLLLVAGASLAGIGAALVSQHVFDMQPCPWCVLQRAVFAAIALVALGGAWLSQRLAKAGALLLTALLAAAGIAAALWQHLVAKSSSSCNLTLADRIAVIHHGRLTPAEPTDRWTLARIGLAMAGGPTHAA